MENTDLEKAYLGQIKNQADTIESQRTRINALYDELAKHDALVKRLYEEADDREWCGEFDDIMDELGFPRRQRPWDIDTRITVDVVVTRTVTAASLEDAKAAVRESAEAIRADISDELSGNVLGLTVESVSEA